MAARWRQWLRDRLSTSRRFNRDLDVELRAHLDHRTEDLVRQGLPRDDVRERALREFGGVERYKELVRDERTGAGLQALAQGSVADLRLAGRRLRHTPVFTIFAVLSLAIGLAVTTSAYALVASLFWKPLPVRDPDRLAMIVRPASAGRMTWRSVMSPAEFADVAGAQRSFATLQATFPFQAPMDDGIRTEITEAEAVTGGYFETLGLEPALGRLIGAADDRAGAAAVAVLSSRFWRARFGEDPEVLGQLIRISEQPFTIVGVVSGAFEGLDVVDPIGTTVWIPVSAAERLPSRPARLERQSRRLSAFGRLATERNSTAASAEVETIAGQLDAADPLKPADESAPAARRWSVRPMSDALRPPEDVGSRLGWLTVIPIVAVLLVACTNLANLMLARGADRANELAVRRALGGSRARLVREMLAEGVLIAVAGAAGAWLLTHAMLVAMSMELPVSAGRLLTLRPMLDGTTLVVAATLLAGSVLIFGLLPALRSTRSDPRPGLATAGLTIAGRRNPWGPIRWQVATAVAFFLVAAITARVVIDQARHDSGIDLDRLALGVVHFDRQLGWDDSSARRTIDAILSEARRQPGIERVAAATGMPFGQTMTPFASVTTPDKPFREGVRSSFAYAIASTPSLFDTIGVSLDRGRLFDHRDVAGTQAVAVVSEAAARELFGSLDVIGREIMLQVWARPPVLAATVIGVVRDTDVQFVRSRRSGVVYLPLSQYYHPMLDLVARTSGEPEEAIPILRRAVRQVDSTVPVLTAGTGPQVLAGNYVLLRVVTALVIVLGGLTLVLAMVGLYGILSQVTTWRMREFGVRMALGATAGRLRRMALAQGFRPVIVGLVIGLGGGTLLRAALRAYLNAPIDLIDPLALVFVPIPFMVAASLACYLPARRASRVDPNVALRDL